ncbi:NAD(P)/FAD-dependent oxidoreductase [Actinomadura sp. 9N215]|uniref:NAD(P)/FAD-dependent oxidoreductase n=1 Tax=Actinomadura sp. 9N215 TaxID=3375150 RepID=UPI0037BDEBDC
MSRRNTDLIVIGGGYAGVMAANRLTQRDDVNVTLFNERLAFVERLRLHQLVAGSHGAVVDYQDLLADRVRLAVDTVTRIDVTERSVTTAIGATAGYDHLIYAVGSGGNAPGVPGAAEFAYPINRLEEALRLRQVLDSAPAAAVTVVGAGPTGIETAAELAEPGRAVTLVCGTVLGPYLHPRGRRSVAKRLAKLGVTVLDGPGTKVTAVTRDAVRLDDGRTLASEITIWTAGFGVPDLAARSGLSTDAVGRLLTDETLTSVDDLRIVAAGDAAAPSGLPFRMSCFAAERQGAHAADTVLSRIAGERPAPINVAFAGMCISLGRHAATAQLAARDDTAKGLCIGGRLGAKIKEAAAKGVVRELTHEARRPGKYSWRLKDDKRRRLVRGERGRAPSRTSAHRRG